MIISRAPVRVSFLGGGTDYPEFFRDEGGLVLGTAIDKFSYITASPFLSHLFDYSIRVSYRKVELAQKVDDIQHNVYRECLKLCGICADVELHAMADLPAFTGLGSSSAFTVSLLHALHAFRGRFRSPHELACEAIHVERHLLHDRVGCQDQIMAAFGGFNLVEFRAEDDFTVHRVPLSPPRLAELENSIFLIFTGVTRRASEIASQQIARIGQNRPLLRQMRAMADQGYKILTGTQSLQQFGELLHEAWQAKRQLHESISTTSIDDLYLRGLQAGAWGGKILGAGGGGFLLFLAPPECRNRLAAAFPDHAVLPVKLNAPGSEIIFS